MTRLALDDVRSSDSVTRLRERTWQARSRPLQRRELVVETAAGALFLCCAVPMAAYALAAHTLDVPLAILLVCLYALASRTLEFPIGAGYVVPTYLVLVPMLVLLPPGVVPLMTAAGVVLAAVARALVGRPAPARALLAIPDAWYAVGPALVLMLAGQGGDGARLAAVYVAAFAAGCLFDLVSAVLRDRAIGGVASHVQPRVIARVWLLDACLAPLGLLLAHAMRHQPSAVLLIFPLSGLLLLASRERSARIDETQRRLELVERERSRLQTAVRRLGDALAAKLDLASLTDIVLRGSIEALDADSGRLWMTGPPEPRVIEIDTSGRGFVALREAAGVAHERRRACQLEHDGVWALALPFGFSSDRGRVGGAVAVARSDRAFREDEEAVMRQLVERGRQAATDIVAHQVLREQAITDPLTTLGNRRKLLADLELHLAHASEEQPLVLVVCDLDGFKAYNDTFGHPAGDALLARLGGKLAAAVAGRGSGYRLGGDEFCALLAVTPAAVDLAVAAVVDALEEHGETFAVAASYGAVVLPAEATTLDAAVQLADERMYALKRDRQPHVRDQTRDVLMRIIHAKQPSLQLHSSEVAELCLRVGRRLGMEGEQLDELARAAELHDVGKVGIPDAILQKPGRLTPAEWEFMRQHTVLGERILSASPALRPVAAIVGATHERWDGRGYPDGLAGQEIPLAARIVAACDAFEAMTSQRSYSPTLDREGACEELRREAGRQFDPTVVALLLEELEDGAAPARSPDERAPAAAAGPADDLPRGGDAGSARRGLAAEGGAITR